MQVNAAQQFGYVPYMDVHPASASISLADLNEKSISVDESERLLSQQIREFYHRKA